MNASVFSVIAVSCLISSFIGTSIGYIIGFISGLRSNGKCQIRIGGSNNTQVMK